jgi:c-di-GMP-binding flagellar brake protein YcgR
MKANGARSIDGRGNESVTFDRRDTFRVRPATREPISVEIVAAGILEMGQLVDISEGGVGVQLEAASGSELNGMEVELLMKFPGTHGVYAKGTVRRVRADKSPVLGIQFIDLPMKALDAIRNYVAGRGQRHSGKIRLIG